MNKAQRLIEQVLQGQDPAVLLESNSEDVTDQIISEIRLGSAVPREFQNLSPMDKVTPAGQLALNKYDGLEMGYISKPLIYDDAFRHMKKTEHKTILRLVLGKKFRVIRVYGPLPGDHRKSRVGSEAEYHYVLKKA